MKISSVLVPVVLTACVLAACSPEAPAPAPATKPAAPAAVTPAAPKPAAATGAAAATKAAAIDPTVLDANGYIRQWLLLGPIAFGDSYNADDIEKEQIPSEGALKPKAGDKVTVTSQEGEPGSTKGVQKSLTWQPNVTSDYFFDFNEAFKLDASDSMGGYAVAYLDVPEEMTDITFSLCSNDNGLIYLNGKNIYKFVGGRAMSEDADTVEKLTLKKGTNVVIFKVWNDSNNWQGCIRLLKKDGKPVTGVKVRLTP